MSHIYDILKINRAAKIRFELYEYQPIKVMERHLTNLTDKRRQVTKKIINPQKRKAKTFSQKHHECDCARLSSSTKTAHSQRLKGNRMCFRCLLIVITLFPQRIPDILP